MRITVFCGANNGKSELYKENAIELGKWIANKKPYASLWWWKNRINGSYC